tara:strand:- start:90 stop:404 length:315 start_codon:yes stop_codon:yes gene_type:complete
MPDPLKKSEYSSSHSCVVAEPVVPLRGCNRHYCFCRNKRVVFGIAERSETCPWVEEKTVETKKKYPNKIMMDDLMDAVTEFWIEWNYSAYHFGREEYLGDYDDL